MNQLIAVLTFAVAAVSFAMEPGQYTGNANAHANLSVFKNGMMAVAMTRQVGGPGGLSNEEIVPYETDCDFAEVGKIVNETADQIEYQVTMFYLIGAVGGTKREACVTWINAAVAKAATGNLRYTLDKRDFQLDK